MKFWATLAVIAAIVIAYFYSRRPVAPTVSGEPGPWATPPGSSMPEPAISIAPVTDWRRRVIDAADALYLAGQSLMSAGVPLIPPRSTFVLRLKEESGWQTRAVMKTMLLAVLPYNAGLARNTAQNTAMRAFNAARDNLSRQLDTFDIYPVASA